MQFEHDVSSQIIPSRAVHRNLAMADVFAGKEAHRGECSGLSAHQTGMSLELCPRRAAAPILRALLQCAITTYVGLELSLLILVAVGPSM